MPRLKLKVLGKPVRTDVEIAAHAMRENHYAVILFALKIS